MSNASGPFARLKRLFARKETVELREEDALEPLELVQPYRMSAYRLAKFQIGQVVRHRLFPFRGVIFDVDPVFANTEEWYQAIPEEVRPSKDQPYYHLFAENEKTHYVAYVSEQNLELDESDAPVGHPDIPALFDRENNAYILKSNHAN